MERSRSIRPPMPARSISPPPMRRPLMLRSGTANTRSFPIPELAKQWKAVPVPAYAEAASGTDAEMTIYQPSTDTMWEFWQARKVDGRWQGCWGGRMQNVSKSQGIWQRPYGTTATGLPFLGGQITAEELRQGEIKHVLGISLVDTEKWNVVFLAGQPLRRLQSQECAEPDSGRAAVPARPGGRCRVTEDAPVGKIIAKAAQKYGFVVWDKAGAITLRCRTPNPIPTRPARPVSGIVSRHARLCPVERIPLGEAAVLAAGLRQAVKAVGWALARRVRGARNPAKWCVTRTSLPRRRRFRSVESVRNAPFFSVRFAPRTLRLRFLPQDYGKP